MKRYAAIIVIALTTSVSSFLTTAPLSTRQSLAMTVSHRASASSPTRRHPAPVGVTARVFGLGGSAARGLVRVTPRGAQVLVGVQVSGLAAGSTHAIHVHIGSCAAPYSGLHLYILGFLRASGSGGGAVQGYVPAFYLAGPRYVIVYAGLAPTTIIGCANLGQLMRR